MLLHGITSTSDAWREVVPMLAERFTVVTSDLMGHGLSAKPRGDYSLGAYASGIRDLLAVLGFERGTVVGHSLGGGIAMQFAYMYPEYTERLVLVSPGGLGREVNPLPRAATLPGSELVLPLIARDWVASWGAGRAQSIGKLGCDPPSDLAELTRGYASLIDERPSRLPRHGPQRVDPDGQNLGPRPALPRRADPPDRLGEPGPGDPGPARPPRPRSGHPLPLRRDRRAGHWPMLDEPELIRELTEFIEETEPFEWSLERTRERLNRGPEG